MKFLASTLIAFALLGAGCKLSTTAPDAQTKAQAAINALTTPGADGQTPADKVIQAAKGTSSDPTSIIALITAVVTAGGLAYVAVKKAPPAQGQ